MIAELGIWQYGFRCGKCVPGRRGFFPFFTVWFCSFTSLPPEGQMFTKEHYRGFYWHYEFRKNIIVTTRTFKLPVRLRIFAALVGLRTNDFYRLPVSFSFWRS
jgi:hypothetical protein